MGVQSLHAGVLHLVKNKQKDIKRSKNKANKKYDNNKKYNVLQKYNY